MIYLIRYREWADNEPVSKRWKWMAEIHTNKKDAIAEAKYTPGYWNMISQIYKTDSDTPLTLILEFDNS